MALQGKVVVVTGSTRGIGRAIAEACAAHGAVVVISSRKPRAVEEAVADLLAAGRSASGVVCDVGKPDDVEALLAHAIDTHGHIDVWFNNAGISPGYLPLTECSAEDLRHIASVNLLGVEYAARLVLPYFAEHGGILVNVSGRGGRGDATPYTAAYGATKAAVLQLTRSLAAENRRHGKVSVHALLPGMVETDFYGPEMRVSPDLEASARNIPWVLRAIGVSKREVGEFAARVAAQEPGRETGRVYRTVRGIRAMRGVARLIGYRMSGRIAPEP
ncbi:MAG TPA: SDR family oxidoreductase [Coriobacteriia bacterium]|jgi:NAD(P)-dependent dehydrogenase (short-subunit alcohol dehydrogenase family)